MCVAVCVAPHVAARVAVRVLVLQCVTQYVFQCAQYVLQCVLQCVVAVCCCSVLLQYVVPGHSRVSSINVVVCMREGESVCVRGRELYISICICTYVYIC